MNSIPQIIFFKQAASQGRSEAARILVKEGGADADLVSPASGVTPLYLAVQFGHLNVTKVLVEEGGAEVDKENTDRGNTALQRASQVWDSTKSKCLYKKLKKDFLQMTYR